MQTAVHACVAETSDEVGSTQGMLQDLTKALKEATANTSSSVDNWTASCSNVAADLAGTMASVLPEK